MSDIGEKLMIRESEIIINIICDNCTKEIFTYEEYYDDICVLKVYPCSNLDCFMSTNFAKENKDKIYKQLKKEFNETK